MFNGLHSQSLYLGNGCSLVPVWQSGRQCLHIRGGGRIRSVLLSGEGDLLSHPDEAKIVVNNPPISTISAGIEVQPDSVEFGTLVADIAPIAIGFPLENDESDLDRPTEGFFSIAEALEDIRQGKVCLPDKLMLSRTFVF